MLVLFDLPIAVEVRDPRLPVSASYRAVDDMPHARRLRRVRERLSLPNLAFVAALVKVLYREDPVGALKGSIYGGSVV